MIEAKDRYGNVFCENEEVTLRNGYHQSTNGRIFIVDSITSSEICESGHMILLKDKETGNLFKRKLDTNWLIKIKN